MSDEQQTATFPSDTIPTRYWQKLDDGRIQCDVCPRECKLRDGQRGLCFVRQNLDDQIVLTTYGRSSGFCIDPIEKKPLNHFYPGTGVLSLGTAGCNLSCSFCQNWDISKAREDDKLQDLAMPDAVARAAVETGCKSVAFTYNDPVIFMEYAIDIAKECHKQGIKTVAVTAGYMKDEARREFYKYMDAANVDLKAFTEEFYKKNTKSELQPVLDTLLYLKHETDVWFEITTLLIPGENDSTEEITAMCAWIMDNLGPDVPIHFSAFHPDYRMKDKAHTPPATLKRARKIAIEAGIKYVYTGNIHDPAGGSTYCPSCGEGVMIRDWHQINGWKLSQKGHCANCGEPVAGHFDEKPGDWGRKRVPVKIMNEGQDIIAGRKEIFEATMKQRAESDTVPVPGAEDRPPPKTDRKKTAQKDSNKKQDSKKDRGFRLYEHPKKSKETVLEPQVAGMFYPEQPRVLANMVDDIMLKAKAPEMCPKAIIAPHAGYRFSAQIAGTAYKAVEDRLPHIKKVVLLGPPHKKPVKGIAVPSVDLMLSPLGPVRVDRHALADVQKLPFVTEDDAPFQGEHGLEVHLPFLQRLTENIDLIPALVGQADPQQVSAFLEKVWGGDETLIVISSDLSHYYKYDDAVKLDRNVSAMIEMLAVDKIKDVQACGRAAIKGLLVQAAKRNLRATNIDLRNSGDTAGKKDSVVGYGAYTFEPAEKARLSDLDRANLLQVARIVIHKGLEIGKMPELTVNNIPYTLRAMRSAFVTINYKGNLRGCYGSYAPQRPLISDVAKFAYHSAFEDPRFKPLRAEEVPHCDLGISVLSIPAKLDFQNEKELCDIVTPKVDGLILRDPKGSGTFLPQVWDNYPDPEQFIRGLKRKAGLPEDYWSKDLQIFRYTAEKIGPVPLAMKEK